MHLSRGDYSRVVRMSRAASERAPSAIAGDLHDSISLLWRQDLVGLPVGRGRLGPLATIARERLDRQGLLFHAAHLGMAFAGAGTGRPLRRSSACCASALRGMPRGSGRGAHPARRGPPGVRASEYRAAIARIEPLQPRLVELGGSRAQRDVFHDTLLEACFRAGDGERATRLLAERVARRPDHYWRHRGQLPAASRPRRAPPTRFL